MALNLPPILYRYPLQPTDFYFITEAGDRYDRLANEFFNDSTYWWVIPAINNLPKDSLFPPVNVQLRMLGDLQAYLDFIAYKNR